MGDGQEGHMGWESGKPVGQQGMGEIMGQEALLKHTLKNAMMIFNTLHVNFFKLTYYKYWGLGMQLS